MDGKKTKFLNQPEYPGGPKALTAFVYKNLKYPKLALEANIEGTVLIEYDINNKGKVIETRLLQGLGYGCDEEARRVVMLLKFDVPQNRGLRVVFHKKIYINFKKNVEKAVSVPVSPAPSFQMNYTIVPSAPVVQEEPTGQKPQPAVFTYTINVGNQS